MTSQEEDDFYVKMDAAFVETAAISYAHDQRYKRYVVLISIVAICACIAASVNTYLGSVRVSAFIIGSSLMSVLLQGFPLLWSRCKLKRMEKRNLVMFRDGMMERMGESPTSFEYHAEMRKFMEYSKRKMQERLEEGDQNGV